MTDAELEEVRRRLAAWRTCEDLDDKRALAAALAGDVPALLAEVEKLEAEVDRLRALLGRPRWRQP